MESTSASKKYIPPHLRPGYVPPPAGFADIDLNSVTVRTQRAASPSLAAQYPHLNQDHSRDVNSRITRAESVEDIFTVCTHNRDYMTPINLCAALSSLAKNFNHPLHLSKLKNYRSFVDLIINKTEETLTEFQAGQLSAVAWASGKIGLYDENFMTNIANELLYRDLTTLRDSELCMLAHGYGSLEVDDHPLFSAIADQLSLRNLKAFRPDGLATLIWAFGKVALTDLNDRLNPLLDAIVSQRMKMSEQELCMSIAASGKLQVNHPTFIQDIAKEVQRRPKERFTSDGLGMLSMGIAGAPYKPQDLVHYILDAVKVRESNQINLEQLGSIGWSLSATDLLTQDNLQSLIQKAQPEIMSTESAGQWTHVRMECYLKGIEVEWPEWLNEQITAYTEQLVPAYRTSLREMVEFYLTRVMPGFQKDVNLADLFTADYFYPQENLALCVWGPKALKNSIGIRFKVRQLEDLGYTVRQVTSKQWETALDKEAFLKSVLA